MVMGPTGPETKNDSAGEGQQQLTRPEQIGQEDRTLQVGFG
jgi:hypothetical protein